VLDFESTLELLDDKGRKAHFKKEMKIRYLQDEILAFQDYAWGDGEILIDYQTNRGRAVDRYNAGYKTYILLALREVVNRGDIDDFKISWGIRNGFLTPDGHWSTEVSHRMKRVRVKIIFPKSRPPLRIFLEEHNRRRTKVLGDAYQERLSDKRWQVSWEMDKPKLYENYILRWDW